jgi:hypothetical protein
MNTILSHVRPKSVSATPLRANKISFASPLRAAFTAAAFCIPTAATLCLPSATTVCAAEISTQEKALNELKARENGTLDLTNESTKKLLKETLGLDDSRFHKDIRYALVDLKAPNNKFTKHIIYLYLDIDGKAISGVKDLLDLKNVKDNWKIYSTSPELESTLNTLTRDIWRNKGCTDVIAVGRRNF